MNNLRGAKIIYQESKATQPSYLYFLQKDANNFDIIVTSESGVKRRFNSNVDVSNYYTKSETYSQNQINTYLSTKLDKGGYTGTAQDLKNSIDSKANISHTHDISSITNLQTTLNNKLNKDSLTSNDDSLLVEGENIEAQLSIYSEEFEQEIFNLTFTPINILGVYRNGIYLGTSEFILNLPKSITINNYTTNDVVIVQYQHLKTDI